MDSVVLVNQPLFVFCLISVTQTTIYYAMSFHVCACKTERIDGVLNIVSAICDTASERFCPISLPQDWEIKQREIKYEGFLLSCFNSYLVLFQVIWEQLRGKIEDMKRKKRITYIQENGYMGMIFFSSSAIHPCSLYCQ